MRADLDLLIHRHLEGALSEADAADLGARLKGDPDARRRLAEMAFDVAQLRDVLSARPKARLRKLPPVTVAAAAAIFVIVVGVVLFAPGPPAPAPVPAGWSADPIRGFAGSVRGVVTGRTEGSFRMKVVEVTGMPGHPLAGRTIAVAPGFARGEAGDVIPHRVHGPFVRRLAEGQPLTIDLRHAGDDVFVIGELSGEQSDWALKRGDVKKPKVGDRPAERELRDGDKEK